MSCLGNAIWILFGGIFTSLYWLFAGVLLSITIIGIPLGQQCFKAAKLTFAPFGKSVVVHFPDTKSEEAVVFIGKAAVGKNIAR